GRGGVVLPRPRSGRVVCGPFRAPPRPDRLSRQKGEVMSNTRAGSAFPRHVADESPLRVSAALAARALAPRFRSAARRFTHPTAEDRRSPLGIDPLVRVACGRLMIEALDRGLIPRRYPELRDLICWHTKPSTPFPGSRVCYVRGPYNLFNDVCGGHLRAARFPAPNKRSRAAPRGGPDPDRGRGGVMARDTGRGHLDLAPPQRAVATST